MPLNNPRPHDWRQAVKLFSDEADWMRETAASAKGIYEVGKALEGTRGSLQRLTAQVKAADEIFTRTARQGEIMGVRGLAQYAAAHQTINELFSKSSINWTHGFEAVQSHAQGAASHLLSFARELSAFHLTRTDMVGDYQKALARQKTLADQIHAAEAKGNIKLAERKGLQKDLVDKAVILGNWEVKMLELRKAAAPLLVAWGATVARVLANSYELQRNFKDVNLDFAESVKTSENLLAAVAGSRGLVTLKEAADTARTLRTYSLDFFNDRALIQRVALFHEMTGVSSESVAKIIYQLKAFGGTKPDVNALTNSFAYFAKSTDLGAQGVSDLLGKMEPLITSYPKEMRETLITQILAMGDAFKQAGLNVDEMIKSLEEMRDLTSKEGRMSLAFLTGAPGAKFSAKDIMFGNVDPAAIGVEMVKRRQEYMRQLTSRGINVQTAASYMARRFPGTGSVEEWKKSGGYTTAQIGQMERQVAIDEEHAKRLKNFSDAFNKMTSGPVAKLSGILASLNMVMLETGQYITEKIIKAFHNLDKAFPIVRQTLDYLYDFFTNPEQGGFQWAVKFLSRTILTLTPLLAINLVRGIRGVWSASQEVILTFRKMATALDLSANAALRNAAAQGQLTVAQQKAFATGLGMPGAPPGGAPGAPGAPPGVPGAGGALATFGGTIGPMGKFLGKGISKIPGGGGFLKFGEQMLSKSLPQFILKGLGRMAPVIGEVISVVWAIGDIFGILADPKKPLGLKMLESGLKLLGGLVGGIPIIGWALSAGIDTWVASLDNNTKAHEDEIQALKDKDKPKPKLAASSLVSTGGLKTGRGTVYDLAGVAPPVPGGVPVETPRAPTPPSVPGAVKVLPTSPTTPPGTAPPAATAAPTTAATPAPANPNAAATAAATAAPTTGTETTLTGKHAQLYIAADRARTELEYAKMRGMSQNYIGQCETNFMAAKTALFEYELAHPEDKGTTTTTPAPANPNAAATAAATTPTTPVPGAKPSPLPGSTTKKETVPLPGSELLPFVGSESYEQKALREILDWWKRRTTAATTPTTGTTARGPTQAQTNVAIREALTRNRWASTEAGIPMGYRPPPPASTAAAAPPVPMAPPTTAPTAPPPATPATAAGGAAYQAAGAMPPAGNVAGRQLGYFGYIGDATPDSNSLKGVGAYSNRMTPGKSAGLSKGAQNKWGIRPGQPFQVGPYSFLLHDTNNFMGQVDYVDIYNPWQLPDRGHEGDATRVLAGKTEQEWFAQGPGGSGAGVAGAAAGAAPTGGAPAGGAPTATAAAAGGGGGLFNPSGTIAVSTSRPGISRILPGPAGGAPTGGGAPAGGAPTGGGAPGSNVVGQLPGAGGTLGALAQQAVGMHTPYGDPNLGCAASVCQILNSKGFNIPSTNSTAQLYTNMVAAGWQQVPLGTPGSVVIAPTQGGNHGHVGIVGNDGRIYSNSSKSGTWEGNYTPSSWSAYFGSQKGLPIYSFLPTGAGTAGAGNFDPSVLGGTTGYAGAAPGAAPGAVPGAASVAAPGAGGGYAGASAGGGYPTASPFPTFDPVSAVMGLIGNLFRKPTMAALGLKEGDRTPTALTEERREGDTLTATDRHDKAMLAELQLANRMHKERLYHLRQQRKEGGSLLDSPAGDTFANA